MSLLSHQETFSRGAREIDQAQCDVRVTSRIRSDPLRDFPRVPPSRPPPRGPHVEVMETSGSLGGGERHGSYVICIIRLPARNCNLTNETKFKSHFVSAGTKECL